MIKRLVKIGNSLGVVLDRPLLKRLGIDEKTEVDVSTDGTIIVLAPTKRRRSKTRAARLKRVADRAFTEYAGVFRKLAE